MRDVSSESLQLPANYIYEMEDQISEIAHNMSTEMSAMRCDLQQNVTMLSSAICT
jgi:hypothetical protein